MFFGTVSNTITRWHRKYFLVAALCCMSCGPGLLEGTELGDTDDSFHPDSIVIVPPLPNDTEEAFEICPADQEAPCADEYISHVGMEQTITASWVSSSAAFTHFSQNLILGIEGRDDEPSLFAIEANFDDVRTSTNFIFDSAISRFSDEIDSPVAWVGGITKTDEIWNSGFHYIAAVATNDGFILVGIPQYVGEHILTPFENSQLVINANNDVDIIGLVYLQNKSNTPSAELDKICLFGEGLFCFDGSEWTTEIAPGQGIFINEVTVSTINDQPMLLAISDTAQLLYKWEGRWLILPMEEADAPLLDISVNTVSQYFTAAGNQFLLHGAVGRTLHHCDVPPHILRFSYYHDTSKFAILADNGWLWAGELDTFQNGFICKTRHLLEGAIDALPAGDNFYVLHPAALYTSENYNLIVAE